MADAPDTVPNDDPWSRVVCVAAVVAGVVLRIVGFARPLDQPSWRQGDLYAIARSFHRETINPLLPRVAWRGTTSGDVEGEFPIIGWTTAMAWRVFGEQEWMLTVLPFVAGLLTLGVFAMLVRKRLDRSAADWAIAFFALNPLAVFVSGAVQSDSLMMLGIVTAIWAAWNWADTLHTATKARRWPLLTAASLILAALSKGTALHAGLAVAAVLLLGSSARVVLRRRAVWVVALVSVAIPALWAAYARTIYNRTGLSLGVSNERHWAGAELVQDTSLLKGIVGHELRLVWLRLGLPLAVLGAVFSLRRRTTQVALLWLASVGIMLLAAGRTTGDSWAYYYHLPAVAPAAMLMGAGMTALVSLARRVITKQRIGQIGTALLGIVVCALGARSAGSYARPLTESPLHRCANEFSDKVKAPDLVLTSGGTRLDSGGHPVAYDASYMFQWLDVFGWTLPIEDQTLPNVAARATQGARWFVAERDALNQAKGFEAELRAAYPIAGQCDAALLFDLRR